MTCKLNCKMLSSSQCGVLIFNREEWATSIGLEETLFQVHQGYHPRCLDFKFYFFFPVKVLTLVDQTCMDWELKFHWSSTTLINILWAWAWFYRLLVAKYDRWEVSNGVPSILQQSTKLGYNISSFLFSQDGWELS